MKNLSILLAILCLYLAPAFGQETVLPTAKKMEIGISDTSNLIKGFEFSMNGDQVIQIYIHPTQPEWIPTFYSNFRNKKIEEAILNSWKHTIEDGAHVLRFDLPKGIFIMSILGKKTKWPDVTYTDDDGRIRNALRVARYTSVETSDDMTPKKEVIHRKFFMLTPARCDLIKMLNL